MIKKIALARPQDHGLAFSTWSLAKLAEHLVAERVVDDISHEGLRVLLREEGVSFQAMKTFKVSNDPDFEAKKNRVLELYDIADPKSEPGDGDPTVHGRVRAAQPPAPSWQAVGAGGDGQRRLGSAPAPTTHVVDHPHVRLPVTRRLLCNREKTRPPGTTYVLGRGHASC